MLQSVKIDKKGKKVGQGFKHVKRQKKRWKVQKCKKVKM